MSNKIILKNENEPDLLSSQNSFTNICLPEELPILSRRQLLGTGVAIAAHVSVNKLLLNSVAQAQAIPQYPPQRKLVWIYMRGGWDILESIDPKPSSTGRIDMPYSWGEAHALAGSDGSIRTGRWMPGLAQIGQDVVLLRGLAMGTTSHDAGTIYMDTGILSNNGRVNAASIPSIIASESSATIPVIQLSGGLEPKTDRGLLRNVSVVRAENLDLYRTMYPTNQDMMQRRLRILDYVRDSVTRTQATMGQNDRLSSIETAESKIRGQIVNGLGDKLQLSAADKAPFTADAAALGQANRMGNGLTDSFALALKLIKNDLVTSINMGIGGFDTHSTQDRSLQPLLTGFDSTLKTFVQELKTANKLDDTLIVLVSDFGRTPKINGSNGRDHWPVGGAALIGGGLAGGRAVGATDDSLLAVGINPDSGLPMSNGVQLNATHLGGAILELTLGTSYLSRRPYLTSLPSLTRLKS